MVVAVRIAWLVALCCAALTRIAAGQMVNPVYVDDSPVARETLQRIDEFEAAGNDGEAVRELQRLLDDQPDRLVAERGQPNLFISVRARVHAKLLASPRLLERYRASETARAQRELEAGQIDRVERSRFLTRPGFEAALRMAQMRLEAAEFEAARMTLEPLATHPDRAAPDQPFREAALAMGRVAAYLDDPRVWALAEQWAAQAGTAAPARKRVEPPASLRLPRSDFVSPGPALEYADVPPRPLWSSPIDLSAPAREPVVEPVDESTYGLFVLPTVYGDCVYINDGTTITSRDRFTLQPRWTVRAAEEPGRRANPNRFTQRSEDTCTVTVRGRTLVTTTGLVQNGMRADGGRTYAIDTATGAVLWSFVVSDLDPSLDGAAVRGPALIEGSTIVLMARKGGPQRRMVGVYLVGVSLEDGSLRWVRSVASAGSIFRGVETRMEHAATLDRGVVYCSDRLGVVAAVEAATGRPVWIRRAPVLAPGNMAYGMMPEPARPWQWDSPLVRDDAVFTVAPDRQSLLVIDRLTGAIRGQRPAEELGSPMYLLPVGERLAAVGGNSVNFVSFDNPIEGEIGTTRTFAQPGIRGRVMVAGSRLLVPRADGLAVIDPARPRRDEAVVRLERLGNVLPLANQLIVADAGSVHSFVTWAVAQRILEDRMNASPQDPDPAITFAELAYRSRHPAQILPALDRAITSIDAAPASDKSRSARARMFDVIREMVEASQNAWAAAAPAPARTPGPRGGPAPRPEERPAVDSPVLEAALLAPIVDRWGRIAETPEERSMHLLALGKLNEVQSRPALAAEAYQRVLGDPVLAGAPWRRGGVSVRAETEAARRTRQLVLDHGPTVYAAFEAQAAHEFGALGPGATAEDAERLARKFPAAAVAATIWVRSAELHENEGRPLAAVAALREGLFAAEASRSAGVNVGPAVIGELGGRLARRLQSMDQVFAAAQLVARFQQQFPGVSLTDRGETVDTRSLAAVLAERLAGLRRLPRVGSTIHPVSQALPGWVIMQPRSKEQAGRACEHVVLVHPGESRVALWGSSGGAPSAGKDPSPLQEIWSRAYTGSPPVLYRTDPDSVWFIWDRPNQGVCVERVEAVSGQTRWITDPFRTLFGKDDELAARVQLTRNLMETPLDGAVKLTDVAVTMDEQVLALVERSGRVACIDPATGKLLWAGSTPVQQVHDADVGGGSLVVGGQSDQPAGPGVLGGGTINLVAVLDARSGRLMHKLEQAAGRVRYIRCAGRAGPAGVSRAAAVVGLDTEVVCLDVETGRNAWTIAGPPAFESREAWVFGDRLFLLDENRSLWLASIATGKLVERQLETWEHLVGTGSIQGFAFGKDFRFTAFATDRGVCLFDDTGQLVGIDAIRRDDTDETTLLAPVPAAGGFVAVETSAIDPMASKPTFNVHFLDAKSAKLVNTQRIALPFQPRRMSLLDGRLLLTAGSNTVVYAIPEADR
jgi:outer membrane protein assembly factor BamB